MHLSAVVLAALLALAPASRGVLMRYSFVQGGFTDGAEITGTFTTKDDLNGDGVFSGSLEVVEGNAGASFSGSSLIPAFGTAIGRGIFGFYFDPATNALNFSSEGRGSDNTILGITTSFGSGVVEYFERGFPGARDFKDFSSAPVVITLTAVDGVPVPDQQSSLLLLALSFSALIAVVHLSKDGAQSA